MARRDSEAAELPGMLAAMAKDIDRRKGSGAGVLLMAAARLEQLERQVRQARKSLTG